MQLRRSPLFVVATLLFGAAASFGAWSAPPSAAEELCAATDVVEGRVVALASSVHQEAGDAREPPSLSLVIRTDAGLINVALAEEAAVTGPAGEEIRASAIPLAALIRVEGRRLSERLFEAAVIEVLS